MPPRRSPRLDESLSPEFFRALCDPQRLSILTDLLRSGGGMTVGEVAALRPIDLSVVSRHIRLLREAGIVTCEKKARQLLCRVDVGRVVATLRAIADALEDCCGSPGAPADRPAPRKRKRASR